VLVGATGATQVPIPEPLIKVLKGRFGFPQIPQGAIDYLKFPCTVDGQRFRKETGFLPAHDLRSTVAAVHRD
jgi:hypothetical protein